MNICKLFALSFVLSVGCQLLADCQNDVWLSFVNEVSSCCRDDTNRVYYAGCSNCVSYLYHESAKGIKEWQIRNVYLSDSVKRSFCPDKMNWVVIKGDEDDKFLNWDIKTDARAFVQRLPSESALVKATTVCYIPDGQYDDGTPRLVCRCEYEVLATKSGRLHKGDFVCTSWLVDCYTATTNILANGGEKQRRSVDDCRTLYVTWDAEQLSRARSERSFFIGDDVAVPLELVWDSDINHESLIPFDEKLAIKTYCDLTEER